jgi:hypothetical protein
MRFLLVIVGALMIVGLAAFGVRSAQKVATPASEPPTSLASLSPAIAASPTAPVTTRNPVNQVAQAPRAVPPAPAVPSVEPSGVAQTTPAAPAPVPSTQAPAPSAQSKSAGAKSIAPCDKPGGMSLARIVEIDTTGGPGFGFEHFKQYDFLRDKEVVLTFDDGPWLGNTPAVLKALADECLKATSFEIGKHAIWHPEITKQVIDAGMDSGHAHLVA